MQSVYGANRFYARPGAILWGIAWGIALLGLLHCVSPDESFQTVTRAIATNRGLPLTSSDNGHARSDNASSPTIPSRRHEGIQFDYGFCPDGQGIVPELGRIFRTAPLCPLKHIKRDSARFLTRLPGAEQMVLVCHSDSDRALLIPVSREPLYLILQFFRI